MRTWIAALVVAALMAGCTRAGDLANPVPVPGPSGSGSASAPQREDRSQATQTLQLHHPAIVELEGRAGQQVANRS